MRLIDADALINETRERYCNGCENWHGMRCKACRTDDAIRAIDEAPTIKPNCDDILEIIEDMPTFEPEPKRGRWEKDSDNVLSCSECGEPAMQRLKLHTNPLAVTCEQEEMAYCPYCGARMEGSENDD